MNSSRDGVRLSTQRRTEQRLFAGRDGGRDGDSDRVVLAAG